MIYTKKILFLFFAVGISLSSIAQTISPDDFEKGLTKGTQLLDVRTSAEYSNSHLPNSLQADWNKQDQFKERVRYLDKNQPVYVYCAAGVRSNAAARWMRENGFKDIRELQGGLTAWNAAKKPTEGVPAEAQLTPAAYASLTGKAERILVDFGAPWCPPCVQMSPVIESLQKDLKNKFTLIKLDPSVQTALAGHLKIDTLPTFIVYKSGKEIFRKQGISSYNELKEPLLR